VRRRPRIVTLDFATLPRCPSPSWVLGGSPRISDDVDLALSDLALAAADEGFRSARVPAGNSGPARRTRLRSPHEPV
jgi:hypothetical protein